VSINDRFRLSESMDRSGSSFKALTQHSLGGSLAPLIGIVRAVGVLEMGGDGTVVRSFSASFGTAASRAREYRARLTKVSRIMAGFVGA
jgi:hypothetical protein